MGGRPGGRRPDRRAARRPVPAALADRIGVEPGVLDVVLVAPPRPVAHPPGWSWSRGHRPPPGPPGAAAPHRRPVWATADGAGLLTLGRGVAGRWEVSLEVDPAARGRGLGTALARAAPALVPDGEPLWAQVAPANMASLRAFLAAGYRPVGAEVLFGP